MQVAAKRLVRTSSKFENGSEWESIFMATRYTPRTKMLKGKPGLNDRQNGEAWILSADFYYGKRHLKARWHVNDWGKSQWNMSDISETLDHHLQVPEGIANLISSFIYAFWRNAWKLKSCSHSADFYRHENNLSGLNYNWQIVKS